RALRERAGVKSVALKGRTLHFTAEIGAQPARGPRAGCALYQTEPRRGWCRSELIPTHPRLPIPAVAINSDLQLPFPRQQVIDRDADFRRAAENRAELLLLVVLERQLVRGLRQRYIADFLRERWAFRQIELDQFANFRTFRRGFAYVDKQR